MTLSQWITSGAGIAVILYIIGQGVYGLRAFGQVSTGLKLTEQALTQFRAEVKEDIAAMRDEIKSEAARRSGQFDNLNPTVATLQMEVGRQAGRIDTMERLVSRSA